jgi:hypothetical protein
VAGEAIKGGASRSTANGMQERDLSPTTVNLRLTANQGNSQAARRPSIASSAPTCSNSKARARAKS